MVLPEGAESTLTENAASPFLAEPAHIFEHPRFLLRGLAGAQTEINLATMVYNLKRMLNILGGIQLRSALAS